MILKEQEILKFDVIDSQKMLIPSDVKINNLKFEYDLTYDFKNKTIGKVKNIKKFGKSLIGDIDITGSKIKSQIKNSVFRPAFKSTEIENDEGMCEVQKLDLMHVSMIPKEKDVYD